MSYTVGSTRVINTTSASGTTDFTFTFPYIKEAHIEVYNNYTKLNQGTGAGEYQVITNVSPKLIRLGTGIPSANVRIEIRRNSSLDSPLVDYADGSTLTANDLDTSALQSLYIDQELKDSQFQTVTTSESTGLPSLGNKRLTEVANPTAAQDAATKNYTDSTIDTKIDSALTDDIAAGSSISITDNSPSSGKVTLNVIAATGSNSGSMSASDKAKLDGIDVGAKDDQTAAEIRALVESATDSNVFTDNDHSRLNAMEDNATADQTGAEIKAAYEAESNTNAYTDAEKSKLAAIDTGAKDDQTASEIKTLLQSDKLTDSEIATGTLDNRYFTETELTGGALDGRYYTETESDARYFNISTGDTIKDGDTFPDNDTTIATTAAINDRIIDLVDDVGGFVPIANETSFPNANPDVNNGAGTLVSIKALGSDLTSNGSGVATISNGTVGNSTVTITGLANSTTYAATFGMIVETTSTLNTYTFHRLVPKATEVSTVSGSISNVNTVAGAISNVNSVASNATNINTVAGINANVTTVAGISSNVTSVAGNSTNINAVNSNATNINTVAGAITNVNNVGGSIANVNTVATNISSVNDFADRYRVASSDPSSNNDTGDLVFNTTSNELRVYNGSAWQGGVTATGNLLSKSGDQMTGNLTFSGSQTVDGRDVSVDGAKLDGIAANANNYTHPNHTGEVTSTADGATVVADNIIDEANLKVSNSPTNGYFLSAQSGNTGGLTWAEVSQVLTEDAGDNLIAGDSAGTRISGGQENVILGDYAGRSITSANYTVVLGKQALGDDGVDTTGNHNVAIGYRTLYACTSGNQNVSIGQEAGAAITTGENNIAIGEKPLLRCTTGKENIALGNRASEYLTTGDANIIMGDYTAQQLTTGDNNVCIGNDSGGNTLTTGSRNICIGHGATVSLAGVSDEITLGDSSNTSKFRIPGINFVLKDNGGTPSSGQVLTADSNGEGYWADGGVSSDSAHNTVAGKDAGSSFSGVNADANSLFGEEAGKSITTGDGNTCLGYKAGDTITTGGSNIIIGNYADVSSATDSGQIVIGSSSYQSKFSVPSCKFVLKNTGTTASDGQVLTADANGEATWEDATAHQHTGGLVTDGRNNVIGGNDAGDSLDGTNSTMYNTFIGKDAGNKLTAASHNTAVGTSAAYEMTTGQYNTCFGSNAGREITTGTSNIAIGRNAMSWSGEYKTGTNNVAIGTDSMAYATSAARNIAIGADTVKKVTTGSRNVGIGTYALTEITTGNDNVSCGEYSLTNVTTGSFNIGVGRDAGRNVSTGSYNIGIGNQTFYTNTCTGDYNVAIGYKVLKNLTSGTHNFLLGNETGPQITTGSYNVAMGGAAMFPVTTGSYNTAFGHNAGGEIIAGDNNTCLGNDAGRNASPSGNIVNGDNVICLGNNNVTDIYCADTSISSSDSRDKADVTNFTNGLNWVNQLNPVTYRWDKRSWYDDNKPDGSKKRNRKHIGFLAQDVLAIEGNPTNKDDMLIVNLNEDDTAYGLKYERLVPVLVNAIKELSAKVTALEAA